VLFIFGFVLLNKHVTKWQLSRVSIFVAVIVVILVVVEVTVVSVVILIVAVVVVIVEEYL
jgi:hypothetical protein